jgi:hypothetical protein
LRRYSPIWTDVLNQGVKHELADGGIPASLRDKAWSAEADRAWLATLGQRFGRFPPIEHLALLILCYLAVIGPVNFFILKRREARVWLIGTVPTLAAAFGAIVLCMGYLSHGVRAATNHVALAVVTPEGDRAFVDEYVAVYGTTSAEYQVDFPRSLHIRPLAEYVASPNGGFENPGAFKLETKDDRQKLRDWRLTFWQTRGMASLDCVHLDGRLAAHRAGSDVTIVNDTELSFDLVAVVKAARYMVGPIKPFQSTTVDLSRSEQLGSGAAPVNAAAGEASESRVGSPAADLNWPTGEALALYSAAARLTSHGGDWVLGLTRQPVHDVRSPDTRRQLATTLYAWPITERGR